MSFLLVKILNAHFNALTYFTGMLSKAKGQILRVSALLNMLFAKFEENDSIDSEHIPLVTRHLWCVVSPPMGRFQSAEMAGPF